MGLALFGGGKKKKSSGRVKDYEAVLVEARAAMKAKDEDKARMLFRRLNRWISEDYDRISKMSQEEKTHVSNILTEAGENLLLLKDYDYAIKTLEKAKSLDPKNYKAWLAIGKNLLERNVQIPYAIACLKEAVRLNPKDVKALLLLGDAYRMQGLDKDALETYKKALEIKPKDEKTIEKVLKIKPDDEEILLQYAEILKKKGKKKELVKVYNDLYNITRDEKYFEMGIQEDPDNKELLISRVRHLMEAKDFVEASKIVEKLYERYPEDPTVKMYHDELVAEKVEEEEEIKPLEVDELFADLDLGFEEMGETEETPAPEVPEEAVEETPEEVAEVKEETKIEEKKSEVPSAPVAAAAEVAEKVAEVKEEAPAPQPEKQVEEKPAEEAVEEVPEEAQKEAPEEKPETEEAPEEISEEKVEEAKEEEKVEEKPDRVEEFLKAFKEGDVDKARELLMDFSEEEYVELMSKEINFDLAKFIVETVSVENGNRMLDELLDNEMYEYVEKMLNEILKKDMKNAKALFYKSRLMAAKDNEMGARNFLMMSIRFDPEMKKYVQGDKRLSKYADKDWFKNIIS